MSLSKAGLVSPIQVTLQERDAITDKEPGYIVFNSDAQEAEMWTGTEWIILGNRPGTLNYRGGIDMTTTAPTYQPPENGDMYLNEKEGIAVAGWGNLEGYGVLPNDRVVFDGAEWALITSGGGIPNLQVVTDAGDTTNHTITTAGYITAGNVQATDGLFSGQVGIGTTSPAEKLTVIAGQQRQGISVLRSSGGAQGVILSAHTSGNEITNSFSDSNQKPLRIVNYNKDNNTQISVATFSNNGNVGIGTNAPAAPLQVLGAGRFGNVSGGNPTVQVTNGSTFGSIEAFQANNTANKLNLCLNAFGGNVGIGTTSPSGKLHVKGSTSGTIHLQPAADNYPTFLTFRNDADQTRGFIKYDFTDNIMSFAAGGSGEKMVITAAGNVGIGTNAPDQLLHLRKASANAYARFTNDTVNGYVGVSNSQSTFDIYGSTAHDMRFLTNNSEKMRLDSSGRLLIGHNDSVAVGGRNAHLQIHGDNAAEAGQSIVRYGNTNVGPGLVLSKSRAAVGVSTGGAVVNGDSLGYVIFGGADGTNINSQAAFVAGFVDADPSTSRIPGRLSFYTTSTGQDAGIPEEKMRLDSSGRLLVGTTQPILDVTSAKFQCSASGGANIVLNRAASTVADGASLGVIRFYSNAGGSRQEHARISGIADGTSGANDKPGRLVFYTTADSASGPTERLRITSEGDCQFGIASSGNQPGSSNRGCWIRNDGHILVSRNVNASGVVFDAWGNAGEARIYGDGDLENTNNRYDGISDLKLKENITDANSQWDDIKALRLVNFNFKEEAKMSTHRQLGLIAQEVEKVSPGLVKDREDHKSVSYSIVYLKAVKALQEAMARIETLESKMITLRSKLT